MVKNGHMIGSHLLMITLVMQMLLKIQIWAIGFITKQKFLYIYDYGDEWTFSIVVAGINENADQILNPYMQETQGESPEQHDGFD
jgi:hypothetical protein